MLGYCKYFTGEQVKCHRQLKAYKFFNDGHVQRIMYHPVTPEKVYCFIRAAVLPSIKTDILYDAWITIGKGNSYVKSTLCTRTAGLAGACNHIAGLRFCPGRFFKTFSEKDEVSFSSKPCQGNKPRKRKLSPEKIPQFKPLKHQYGKKKRETVTKLAYYPGSALVY